MISWTAGVDATESPRPWELWPTRTEETNASCANTMSLTGSRSTSDGSVRLRGWVRWPDELVEPTVSWQRLLSSAVRQGVGRVAGPSRLQLPQASRRFRRARRHRSCRHCTAPPRVAMVLDTSGSMSDSMLGQSLAEVGGVLRSLGNRRRNLKIVCCDAKAFGPKGDEGYRCATARRWRHRHGRRLVKAAELRPVPISSSF